MENELQAQKNQNVVRRDINIVTDEIRGLIGQAQRVATVYAVEIGRRLAEAKSMLLHGQWGLWLKNEISFSERTAQNFMSLFEEYGDQQLSIFDAITNTKSIADLPYTKALALLSVPADEREEFAEEVHADELSVRELKEAIRAREEAEAERYDMERNLDSAMEENKKLKEQVDFGVQESKSISESLRTAKMQKAAAEQALEQARKDKEKAEAALKEALEHPQLTDEQKDALIADAAEDAAAQAKKAEEKRVEKLQEKLQEAEAERAKAAMKAAEADAAIAEAERRAEEAEKKLRTASPEVAAFKAVFNQAQKLILDLKAQIDKIETSGDIETAEKLRAAMDALKNAI